MEEAHNANANGKLSIRLLMILWKVISVVVIVRRVVLQVQFACIALHSLQLVFQPSCRYPKFTVGVIVPQNVFLFFLFYDFYRKAYSSNKKEESPRSVADSSASSVADSSASSASAAGEETQTPATVK